MKNTTTIILRSVGLAILGFCILEFAVETDGQWAFEKHPILWLIWGVFILFIAAIEVVLAALQRILYDTLSAKQKESYQAKEAEHKEKQFAWFKQKYKAMLDSKPMEKEEEIMMDHNYDGIRE